MTVQDVLTTANNAANNLGRSITVRALDYLENGTLLQPGKTTKSFQARFQVPKGSISWLIARVHVGTPDAEVEIAMRLRLLRATPAQRNACVKYALKCHHENQGLYSHVIG